MVCISLLEIKEYCAPSCIQLTLAGPGLPLSCPLACRASPMSLYVFLVCACTSQIPSSRTERAQRHFPGIWVYFIGHFLFFGGQAECYGVMFEMTFVTAVAKRLVLRHAAAA